MWGVAAAEEGGKHLRHAIRRADIVPSRQDQASPLRSDVAVLLDLCFKCSDHPRLAAWADPPHVVPVYVREGSVGVLGSGGARDGNHSDPSLEFHEGSGQN